ncbi:MAG: SAVED domain-containing protein [Actinomycetota bacterium]
METFAWWVGLLSGVWGIIGGLLALTWERLGERRLRKHRLEALRKAAATGEVAVCVGLGGVGVPEPDVVRFLREHHPAVATVMVYQAPDDAKLDDPATALRVVEDLREWMREYGRQPMTRLHFFPAGMIAYPFLVGAMLSNLCPVVVYHRQKSGTYVPLYEWVKDAYEHPQRLTRRLASWKIVSLPLAETAFVLAAGPMPDAVSLPGAAVHTDADLESSVSVRATT